MTDDLRPLAHFEVLPSGEWRQLRPIGRRPAVSPNAYLVGPEGNSDDGCHRWQWDEGSSGFAYQYCRACLAYRDDVLPNEHHALIRCPKELAR